MSPLPTHHRSRLNSPVSEAHPLRQHRRKPLAPPNSFRRKNTTGRGTQKPHDHHRTFITITTPTAKNQCIVACSVHKERDRPARLQESSFSVFVIYSRRFLRGKGETIVTATNDTTRTLDKRRLYITRHPKGTKQNIHIPTEQAGTILRATVLQVLGHKPIIKNKGEANASLHLMSHLQYTNSVHK